MLLGRKVLELFVYIYHTVQRVCRFFPAFPSKMKSVEASKLSLIPTRQLYHAVASLTVEPKIFAAGDNSLQQFFNLSFRGRI